jgi:hypothetical protein
MWRNPIKAGFNPQPLMSGIPGAVPWILLVMILAVVIVPFTSLPAPHVVKTSPLPVTVEARIATQGRDSHQRILPFTIYVLTQQLSWTLESTEQLEGGQTLFSPELMAAVNRAPEVFCVGTASNEGVIQVEESRAAERARRLADWVGAVVGNTGRTRVFGLNAGQYKGPEELESACQRRAIIMVTGPHDGDVDLRESLTSGLEQTERSSAVVYSLLHHYSRSKEWLKLPRLRAAAPAKPEQRE